MQFDIEQSITVVAWLLATIGFLYCAWPLVLGAVQFYQRKFGETGDDGRDNQRTRGQEHLSAYEQLVKLLNDDIQVVTLLLQKLACQVPDQTEDWYCRMALKQMQVWIISKISAARNDINFGEQQASKYLAKYRDRPIWWVYRKLAVDYDLFRDGFNQAPSDLDNQTSPFTNAGNR